MTRTVLEEIRQDLQEHVLDKLRLRAPGDNPENEEYLLKTPVSYLVKMPSLSASDTNMTAPAIAVSFSKENFDWQDSTMEILLHGAVYTPGITLPEENGNVFIQADDGYWDLINLLDSLVMHIHQNGVLAEKYELVSSVVMQLDEKQTWPYWTGTIQFTIKIPDAPANWPVIH